MEIKEHFNYSTVRNGTPSNCVCGWNTIRCRYSRSVIKVRRETSHRLPSPHLQYILLFHQVLILAVCDPRVGAPFDLCRIHILVLTAQPDGSLYTPPLKSFLRFCTDQLEICTRVVRNVIVQIG